MSATNAHILLSLARTKQLNQLLDSGQLREQDVLSHPLARPIPAAEFKRALFKSLSDKGPKLQPKRLRFFSRGYHSRRHYSLKTSRIYFTKNRSSHTPWVSEAVIGSQSNTHSMHHLERMEKRRECSICRYDFRNGKQDGRRRPKLTQFECRTCSPPTALCALDSMPCFSRWHGLLELS